MTTFIDMRRWRGGSLFPLCFALMAGCNAVDVINTNNPSIDQLTGSPTAATVATATQGMLISIRGLAGTYAQTAGIFGREVYRSEERRVGTERRVRSPQCEANRIGQPVTSSAGG